MAMETYSQSYPDSCDSSPISRDIDCDNSPPSTWNDSTAAPYKVKFMCSYGGKIQPRPHDNQLSYVGGDTKILSLDRNSKFSGVFAKLASLCETAPSVFCFKYQLPGEDLDALISVTNDEDLEHMMIEYDRLNRSSLKPARLRIFLFPLSQKPNSEAYGFKETKPEGNWFLDSLNPVQFRPLDVSSSSPPVISEPVNPDFLFGFDKATNDKVSDRNASAGNLSDLSDKVDTGGPVASVDGQMEKLHIGEELDKSCECAKPNCNSPTDFQPEYYKIQKKAPPVTMTTAYYWPERQVPAGNYPVPGLFPVDQRPIYLIQNLPGVYHHNPSIGPTTGVPAGQGYYSLSRVMPEVYSDHPLHNAVPPHPPSSMIQQPKVTAMQDGTGGMRQPPIAPPPAPGLMTEQGYKLCYDMAGRPLYYAVSVPAQPQKVVATPPATAVDGRGNGVVGSDGEVAGKVPQTSSA